MITETILRSVIEENSLAVNKKKVVKREKELSLKSNLVIVITGVRRCGKSTLLQQSLKDEQKKIFLNFEDTRLDGFEISDFNKLEKIAVSKKIKFFVFDEIQNIEGWEKYIRSAHDKAFRIFITGSNALMLSRELGTKLTGRYIQTELFPFSYNEYLLLTKETAGVASLKRFMQSGGFPEFLLSKDNEYLRTLLRDIIIRDIAVRRNIKNEHTILRLATHLMSNVGKEISYNNLSKELSIKSVRTTIDYCDYLKESYLLDFIPRFSFSIKQQLNNPKKVYSIDTGMAKANSISFSEDYGRMLENAVFMKLRHASQDIMYFKDGNSECDFLIRKNEKIITAIQVCWQLTEDNMEREINGLKAALKLTKAKKGVIVTLDQEDVFGDIQAVPAWKWFRQDLII
ncbi:MAG: ATP-binding protein [Bacteroidetes bacterium]|nr:ATP-binding protein [Bacteroidota bacterium]